MFMPHPNLGDDVNGNIVQSEIEGGVFLEGLPQIPFYRFKLSTILIRRCFWARAWH